jgi:hypothetical protein
MPEKLLKMKMLVEQPTQLKMHQNVLLTAIQVAYLNLTVVVRLLMPKSKTVRPHSPKKRIKESLTVTRDA